MSSAEPVATCVNGHTFTIDTRYVLTESRILGKGSFGVVCTAYDSVRKIDLAVKRIRPYANDDWDAKHTLREIRLLKLLGPHPNIISLYELSLFLPKTELYMMMELMDCDLHRVIQSKQSLSEKHHKCFLKQMLEGIKAMHSIGVFHRDLKPGNILVSKDCQLRITDFGLARFMDNSTRRGENELNPMTQYVVTRWYRPPELLLAPNLPYGEPVDLWSIGCILAELLRRKPLFPGKSHLNQAQLIFELKGYTSSKELGFPVSAEAASFLDKKCRYKKQSIRKYVPDASEQAINLLELLLSVDPAQRPTAEQALRHPFLADAEVLHDYSKTYLTRPSPEYFEFEHTAFTVPQLRALIEHEVEIAAADAYRTQRTNSPGTKRRGTWEEQDLQQAANEAQQAPAPAPGQFQRRGSKFEEQMHEEADGPPSQLPTYRGNGNVTGAVLQQQQQLAQQQQAQQPQPQGGGRSEKGANNPFRAAGAGASRGVLNGANNGNPYNNLNNTQDRPRSVEDSTQSNAQNQPQGLRSTSLKSSRSERDLLTDDNEVIPAHQIPAGNLLTAMRNESTPGHVPPGSRTKTPKTPSPKKMDQILQRDMLNKRRFQLQQQNGQGGEGEDPGVAGLSAGVAAGVAGSYQNTRSNRNSFPANYHSLNMPVQEMNAQTQQHSMYAQNQANNNNHSAAHARSQSAVPEYYHHQQQQSHGGAPPPQALQVNRFGKLIPATGAPFPTIASRLNANNTNTNAPVPANRVVRRTNPITGAPIGHSGNSDQGNPSGGIANPHNMQHSNTMMHSGSNVINSEYSNQY